MRKMIICRQLEEVQCSFGDTLKGTLAPPLQGVFYN
jgi:hypothetical protein